LKDIFIGIDFSLKSPGICIYKDNTYKWLSFISLDKKHTKKEIKVIEELSTLADVEVIELISRDIKKKVLRSEFEKLRLYTDNALLILKHLKFAIGQRTDDTSLHFIFEGYSYGSQTNNLIDIVGATTILKNMIILEFIYAEDSMIVLAPTTIKKQAGHGRYNKRELWDVFSENRLGDKDIVKSDFYNFAKELEIGKKVYAPLDDLVDSYLVINAGIRLKD